MARLVLEHDPEADALYVRFAKRPVDRTEQLDDLRNVDYAADGSVVGVEILYPSHGVDVAGLPRADDVADLLGRRGFRVASAEEVATSAAAALAADPSWQRLALARAVARAVADYRAREGLTMRALATRLAMQPSAVARLEAGEHNPSLETLQRLAEVLQLRVILDVAPAGRKAAELRLPAGVRVVGDSTTPAGTRLVVAAG